MKTFKTANYRVEVEVKLDRTGKEDFAFKFEFFCSSSLGFQEIIDKADFIALDAFKGRTHKIKEIKLFNIE